MKAISIYALTREQDMNCLQKILLSENERMGAKQYESPG